MIGLRPPKAVTVKMQQLTAANPTGTASELGTGLGSEARALRRVRQRYKGIRQSPGMAALRALARG